MNTQPWFAIKNGVLHAEGLALTDLAKRFGTPLYVYSYAALKAAWQRYANALKGRKALVCYGMKANSNLAVLNVFHNFGAGFDIVSGGELARTLAAGACASKIVFSGVGKQAWEIRNALIAGIKCFNVESIAELEHIAQIAQDMNVVAPISIRVNPDVDAKTHPYISTGLKENKFGVDINKALDLYLHAKSFKHLSITGLDCHIGSQITQVEPYLDALDKLLNLIDKLAANNIQLKHLDIGGGLGIRYLDEQALDPAQLLEPVFKILEQRGHSNLELVLEPGRSLVGNAGLLLTQVQYLKHNDSRNFAIVDAAMNDLMRPALYEAWHDVIPVVASSQASLVYDVVGPICESGDWLARQRQLPIAQNDLLAIMSAGAYAFTMASQYNTRGRPAEILVKGNQAYEIRPRETVAELFASEVIPDLNK